jgi:hypothetical protein
VNLYIGNSDSLSLRMLCDRDSVSQNLYGTLARVKSRRSRITVPLADMPSVQIESLHRL